MPKVEEFSDPTKKLKSFHAKEKRGRIFTYWGLGFENFTAI